MIGHLPAFHAHMHMQAKDQITAGGFLQLIYDFIISCMICDELTFLVAERVCT